MTTIGFKEHARQHQIKFRNNILNTGHGKYETFLTDEDAEKGLIFYQELGIFEAAKERYDPNLTQN